MPRKKREKSVRGIKPVKRSTLNKWVKTEKGKRRIRKRIDKLGRQHLKALQAKKKAEADLRFLNKEINKITKAEW